MSRISRVLAVAVIAAAMVVQMAVPTLANDRDHAAESATVTLSVADGNLRGFLMEAEQDATNVSCSIPNWSAVNQQAADIPGVTFIYGRDIAEATLVCTNADPLTGGTPTSYGTYITMTIMGLNPASGRFEQIDTATCTGSAAASQNVTPCTMTHDYLNRDDNRQLWYRKVVFEAGVIVNGVREQRTAREFGPLSPSYLLPGAA